MLINEIFNLSRIEAGRFDLKEEAVSLAHIVKECRRLLGLRAKKRHITIEKAVEHDLPQILGDARAIRQVVLNLLSNANYPGRRIDQDQDRLDLKWRSIVAVRDSSPGIPEDEIPIVMSAFGRGILAQKNPRKVQVSVCQS
jgi:two-component system cell cycle sensor histidine kinase PleC